MYPPIALLHLSPRLGALKANTSALEKAVIYAHSIGASWVVTPELALSGYLFGPVLGSDWICSPDRDPYVQRLQKLAQTLKITLFLGHAEREGAACYNSVLVLGATGILIGRHRKCNVVPIAESWAIKGGESRPVVVDSVQVGLLVCADAYTDRVAKQLLQAQILLSPAAWPPLPHGPENCWAERSKETSLPLLVCNRTGREGTLEFSDGESAGFYRGEKLFSYVSERAAVLLVGWEQEKPVLNQVFTIPV